MPTLTAKRSRVFRLADAAVELDAVFLPLVGLVLVGKRRTNAAGGAFAGKRFAVVLLPELVRRGEVLLADFRWGVFLFDVGGQAVVAEAAA